MAPYVVVTYEDPEAPKVEVIENHQLAQEAYRKGVAKNVKSIFADIDSHHRPVVEKKQEPKPVAKADEPKPKDEKHEDETKVGDAHPPGSAAGQGPKAGGQRR